MTQLDKSKLLAYRQCEKRLWLEVYHPELQKHSPAAQASLRRGNEVGAIARELYGGAEQGKWVQIKALGGIEAALERTAALMKESPQPIFEAGFSAEGITFFADVLLPVKHGTTQQWRIVEAKAATKEKGYYNDDVAIQYYIAEQAGVKIDSISLAFVDSAWMYLGGGDYRGMLHEQEATRDASNARAAVSEWVSAALHIISSESAPQKATGVHCRKPYECAFLTHCKGSEAQTQYPKEWLPNVRKPALKDYLDRVNVKDLRDVPDALLNELQLRVKTHTLDNTPYLDHERFAAELAQHTLPLYFLDFETVSFVVPVWVGTRPYEQIPFQFSLHQLCASGELKHVSFLNLTGVDPSEAFAIALVQACGSEGTIYGYNTGFEMACLKELARRWPQLGEPLEAIAARLVDFMPLMRRYTYHPSQQGSWSLKKVVPAWLPESLGYASLVGVKEGTMASAAYLEAMDRTIAPVRHEKIRQELFQYCKKDTAVLVDLWRKFSA